ncbi:ABC transporter permease protein [Staphylococcus aureus]|nr:ABC transporter permease protein [Staphylococcus aureus]CAC7778640.1 ABC transporter permease protein [Staphylococcus aureus]CAC7883770.1 ABC transporter permease protein [Staphylococcus aureus]CAC7884753.1 ABC transporter permease protein [Staphylococcus aureus]CXM78900.1 ABC transporter permease protein [Staphylococcus aureus]
MILSYLKIEFKVIMRKKTTLILSILFPVIFYILFTSILELPEDVKPKFYKEYMYNSKSSPDSCVKCYTMFLPFLLIKIDVFS